MGKILKRISGKLSSDQVISELNNALSLSELNTFLLELFKRKTDKISPAQVLNQFTNNRFVKPADIDTLKTKKTELELLVSADKSGFKPVTLSPVAPMGSCSAEGLVDQNNVLSAVRGVEVVSDATNVLALIIADLVKKDSNKDSIYQFSCIHRHIRGQSFDNPMYSAHFSNLCLTSGGFDTGNYDFEIGQLNKHLSFCYHFLEQRYGEDNLLIRFFLKKDSEKFRTKLDTVNDVIWDERFVEFQDDTDNDYYKLLQFKIYYKKDDLELNVADGGIVDWTQKLLSNKKHRLFISAIGVELINKLDAMI